MQITCKQVGDLLFGSGHAYISRVLVNGREVVRDGQPARRLPGRVLGR
jgi:cytosine/adenosine deaminase-related metal-dependent hydrolase